MRGDEAQLSTTEGDDFPERRGGRHAAPRKSLLTKLHIPASKAIALAAMPTAVFVGMGLTPKLAMADDQGDIPFASGPCVSRSDEPSPSDSASDSPSPSASASDKAKTDAKDAKAKKDDKAGDAPSPSATPSAGETGSTKKKSAESTSGSSSSDQASPSPAATESKNPLDPLGVGDALKNLLHPGKETASPSADPSSSTTSETAAEKKAAEKKAAEKKAAEKKAAEKKASVADAAGKVVGGATSAADKTAEKIREAAAQAGKTVKELPSDAKGLDPRKDTAIPDGAKPSYPCPTADPKALAAADLEKGIPALPDDPWTLKSSMLTLKGLDYKGIVEVRTGSGKIKKVLKFTASALDIKDLHQMTVGPNGSTGHVKGAAGSTSTIRDGEVTMYTESLQGNLFGLIPITFSPDTPPPINVPFAFFTNVTVKQAGQFGGTLHVPGLQNYFTGA
ncbi:hypothetical protein OG217_11030 [Streptomyces sp. NBC_01023]|uniref:hypothetical protein n=1 Tax=Streptomyces sp. NBC_01023 TaxID=2903724 RepID=UPI00386C4765|nr:hypothetical protein OG217_11030 [Streptomyces sp. NBC_01023]